MMIGPVGHPLDPVANSAHINRWFAKRPSADDTDNGSNQGRYDYDRRNKPLAHPIHNVSSRSRKRKLAGKSPFFLSGQQSLAFDNDPMQSHELLREVFEKCSAKQISGELGLSLSLIYKWAEPPDEAAGSGAANPLDRIEALYRCSKDIRLVEWICQRAGGFFIRNPTQTNAHPDYLIPATNQIVQEFADLLAVIATAAADNQISSSEARTIRARWEELKSVTECFVACCEQGNFRQLKDKAAETQKGNSK